MLQLTTTTVTVFRTLRRPCSILVNLRFSCVELQLVMASLTRDHSTARKWTIWFSGGFGHLAGSSIEQLKSSSQAVRKP